MCLFLFEVPAAGSNEHQTSDVPDSIALFFPRRPGLIFPRSSATERERENGRTFCRRGIKRYKSSFADFLTASPAKEGDEIKISSLSSEFRTFHSLTRKKKK